MFLWGWPPLLPRSKPYLLELILSSPRSEHEDTEWSDQSEWEGDQVLCTWAWATLDYLEPEFNIVGEGLELSRSQELAWLELGRWGTSNGYPEVSWRTVAGKEISIRNSLALIASWDDVNSVLTGRAKWSLPWGGITVIPGASKILVKGETGLGGICYIELPWILNIIEDCFKGGISTGWVDSVCARLIDS
jgi:hypothetical protein